VRRKRKQAVFVVTSGPDFYALVADNDEQQRQWIKVLKVR
jgi:hypothetical protein